MYSKEIKILCIALSITTQYKAFFRSNRIQKENLRLIFVTHYNLNKLQ